MVTTTYVAVGTYLRIPANAHRAAGCGDPAIRAYGGIRVDMNTPLPCLDHCSAANEYALANRDTCAIPTPNGYTHEVLDNT